MNDIHFFKWNDKLVNQIDRQDITVMVYLRLFTNNTQGVAQGV